MVEMNREKKIESSNEEPILELKNISVEFKTVSGGTMKALNDISLSIQQGELVSVVGRSGCGKSTLLNVVAGLLYPTSGEALINGKKIEGPGRDRGVVFQGDAIFGWKKVGQNVDFALKFGGIPKQERSKLVDKYLEMVYLKEFKTFFPKELSGGMKKRLQLAMVLANSPDMLLMDEAFGALDYATKIDMQMEIESIRRKEPVTTLFVTHDVEEATFLADRIIMMESGKLCEEVVVDLPRPRTLEQRKSPEFLEISQHFLNKLLDLDRQEKEGKE